MVSFSRTHFKLGVGCVIKNTEEALVYAMSKMIPMYLFPTEVEALAFKEATLWICQLHLSHVSIEMDCKSVVDVLNYCRRVVSMSDFLPLNFVKRQANHARHLLARASRLHASPSIWLEASPFLVETLATDCFPS